MASVPSYIKKYLRMKPEVAQIFTDLESFKDFIRLQFPAVPFNDPCIIAAAITDLDFIVM